MTKLPQSKSFVVFNRYILVGIQ